jgi:hypothetical protein
MSPEEGEKQLKRRRQTLYLLGAGAVSLLLPLTGVAYLSLRDAPSSTGHASAPEDIFDRRDSDAQKHVKVAVVPPPAPLGLVVSKPSAKSQSSSLGFVSTGGEYYTEKTPPSPPAAAPSAAEEEPKQVKKKSPPPAEISNTAKKPLNYPRLKKTGSSSYTPSGFSEKSLGLGSNPE